MAGLIKIKDFKEGEVFCKWLYSRLIRNNKNVLGVELGSTGSGKSYRDLRKAELWYDYYFKEPFPVENICFGVLKAMKRLSSGNLRRGEVIIFEEAGANLGNLDFQNRISKMFTYVLQSFRSMNIAIFFNLPHFTMLNKTARMLMHYTFESAGIDYKSNQNKCKPLFIQINQRSGKSYAKYPIAKINGSSRQIREFSFSRPSQYLIDAYEKKKEDYLNESITNYTDEIEAIEEEKKPKRLKPLEPYHQKIYDLKKEGMFQKDIAKVIGCSQQNVCRVLQTINKLGYNTKKPKTAPKTA